jgi:hypothetical protein
MSVRSGDGNALVADLGTVLTEMHERYVCPRVR